MSTGKPFLETQETRHKRSHMANRIVPRSENISIIELRQLKFRIDRIKLITGENFLDNSCRYAAVHCGEIKR